MAENILFPLKLIYASNFLIQQNNYRTLMNQIVSSGLKTHIIENILIHMPITLHYLFSNQTPEIFCQFDFFVRYYQASHNLLLILAFIIVRYIYVFHAKNITAIQDDFWIFFLNIWNLSFCAIAYFVEFQITENRPRPYYFCLGKISQKSKLNGPFVSYIFQSILMLTVFALLFVGIMYKIRDQQFKEKNFQPISDNEQGFFFKELKKTNLATFVEVVIAIIVTFITVSFPVYQIEHIDLDLLIIYPGYLWVYVFHLYQPQTVKILVVFLVFGKNLQVRNFVKRIVFEKLRIIQHKY